MKRISIIILSITTLLTINLSSYALSGEDSVSSNLDNHFFYDYEKFKLKRTSEITSSNIVKLNFTSLIFTNIGLQYERILSNKISVALGVRFMPKGKLPLRNTVMSFVDYDENSQESEEGLADFFDNTRVGGFAITPEFRYYFKQAGRGLYIAPYLRYGKYNLTSTYTFVDEDKNRDIPIDFVGNYSNVGVGILLGSQFNFGDRVTLDWWILGPFIGSMNFKLNASGYTLTNDEYNAVKEDFDDFNVEFLNYKFEKNLTHSSMDIGIKGMSSAIRSFGLNLGIKF